MCALHCCCWCKGPAWTALTLILYSVNLACSYPVNFCWNTVWCSCLKEILSWKVRLWYILKTQHLWVLLTTIIRQEIVSSSPSCIGLIDLGDLFIQVHEVSLAHVVLLHCLILLRVFGNVLHELEIVRVHLSGRNSTCKSDSNERSHLILLLIWSILNLRYGLI